MIERKKELVREEKRKRTNLKAGRDTGLSGRELFTFNPELATQDDDEADETAYKTEEVTGDEQAEVEEYFWCQFRFFV